MSPPHQADRLYETVAVVGVGFIGGSIASAVKRHGVAETVVGLGRNRERLEAARASGLIDRVETDGAAIADADFVVVCTPVDRIAADVMVLAAHAKPGTLFTDAGSVKESICRALAGQLPEGVEFIGSHPLAGSEKAGFENADGKLFDNRVCIVTPEKADSPADVSQLRAFWESLGMRVEEMSPLQHDEILAMTSHLPHAAAAALAAMLTDDSAGFAATGFRDTTRIAAGDPDLWTAIFSANREPLLTQIDRFQQRLATLREAIAAGDERRVASLLREAQERRARLG